jgi:RHS repeat-associated protein
VTNGASWVTYRHDANGRRTVSTNSAGTVRRLLVAPTPGTDLESPQLIANASGTVQQGYVYLGGDPILRYTTNGTAAYYLEDGMGSVIGLAPATSPSTANTTRLFYDGFGNGRGTNGPAPTIPTGTGGDFRFQGAWLETDSGLHNMRAREYDARLGRFTSRDPRNGVFQRAETLNPYVYAVNNPFVFADPSGEFTLIDITASQAIDVSLQTLKQTAIYEAKQYIKGKVFEAVSHMVLNQLGNIYPPLGAVWESLKSGKLANAGRAFENAFKKQVCGAIGADGPITKLLWFYPGINDKGQADSPGLNCPKLSMPKFEANNSYPDFIISEVAPDKTPDAGRAVTIGDFKISGNSLYNQYVKSGPQNKREQFDRITAYAGRSTYSRTAVFLTLFSGQQSKLRHVALSLGEDGLRKGVVVIVVAAKKNRNFNDENWQ